MRGIATGQKIHLYIIPEVAKRIEQELAGVLAWDGSLLIPEDAASGGLEPIRWHFCVPAWLMINSMRMEALQFMQVKEPRSPMS